VDQREKADKVHTQRHLIPLWCNRRCWMHTEKSMMNRQIRDMVSLSEDFCPKTIKVNVNHHMESESCVPLEIARRKSLSTVQCSPRFFFFHSHIWEPSSGKEQLLVATIRVYVVLSFLRILIFPSRDSRSRKSVSNFTPKMSKKWFLRFQNLIKSQSIRFPQKPQNKLFSSSVLLLFPFASNLTAFFFKLMPECD
jgi:hypothetical protein